MPNKPPVLDDYEMNSWAFQTTNELNQANVDINLLKANSGDVIPPGRGAWFGREFYLRKTDGTYTPGWYKFVDTTVGWVKLS